MKRFRAFAIGLFLAMLAIAIVAPLPDPMALDVLAALLVLTAGIYVGFGLSSAQVSNSIREVVGGVLFLAVALAGRWYSPTLLAAGWFAHVFWDRAHHPRLITTAVPPSVLPACVATDCVLAAYIVVRFYGGVGA